jgi:hypothetical protein
MRHPPRDRGMWRWGRPGRALRAQYPLRHHLTASRSRQGRCRPGARQPGGPRSPWPSRTRPRPGSTYAARRRGRSRQPAPRPQPGRRKVDGAHDAVGATDDQKWTTRSSECLRGWIGPGHVRGHEEVPTGGQAECWARSGGRIGWFERGEPDERMNEIPRRRQGSRCGRSDWLRPGEQVAG